MPETGIEPVRPCGRGILSPLRLPVSPLRPKGEEHGEMIISIRNGVLKRPLSFPRIRPLPFIADMVAVTAKNDRHFLDWRCVPVQVNQREVAGRVLPDDQSKTTGTSLERECIGRLDLYGSERESDAVFGKSFQNNFLAGSLTREDSDRPARIGDCSGVKGARAYSNDGKGERLRDMGKIDAFSILPESFQKKISSFLAGLRYRYWKKLRDEKKKQKNRKKRSFHWLSSILKVKSLL